MVSQDEVKNFLAQLIAEAMYMEVDELEDDALFSDFGLESITLARVVEKLCGKYSCKIELKELLPHQTLNEASVFIYEEMAKQKAA